MNEDEGTFHNISLKLFLKYSYDPWLTRTSERYKYAPYLLPIADASRTFKSGNQSPKSVSTFTHNLKAINTDSYKITFKYWKLWKKYVKARKYFKSSTYIKAILYHEQVLMSKAIVSLQMYCSHEIQPAPQRLKSR